MGQIDVAQQTLTVLLSVLLGAVLCLFYDVIRFIHKKSVKGFFEVLVTDILFWLAAAFVTFCFLIIRCQGNVRGFVMLGILLGFVVTRLTLSKLFLAVVEVVYKVFGMSLAAISKSFGKVVRPFLKTCKKIMNVIKKGLQDKAVLLYNHLKVRRMGKESTDV